MIEDRISRSSICITVDEPYDLLSLAHNSASAYEDPLERKWFVGDCVKVLLETVCRWMDL